MIFRLRQTMLWKWLLLILLAMPAWAVDQQDLLAPDQAFKLALVRHGDGLQLTLEVAPGYYVYRDRIGLDTVPADLTRPPVFPAGVVKQDPWFGRQVVYEGPTRIDVPLQATAPAHFTVNVRLQGCALAGVCYPPLSRRFEIGGMPFVNADWKARPPAVAIASQPVTTPVRQPKPSLPTIEKPRAPGAMVTRDNPLASVDLAPATSSAPAVAAPVRQVTVFAGSQPTLPAAQGRAPDKLPLTLLAFFLAGLGMAFTACMYPLLPILSSLIAGEAAHLTRWRGFLLSMAYVQGLALTYTVIGVIAGLTGALLTVWLQQPAVILTASGLMVLLALSMFGLFTIQLPASVQSLLAACANRLPGGRLLTVAGMGALSALIIGPCVAPPLALALAYISQSGDAALGALALYLMALGLGLPLLLIGTFGGQVLPHAGRWMNAVRSVFGVVMLGLAVVLATPFLPGWLVMLLWAMLAIGSAVFLRAFEPLPSNAHAIQRLSKALGLLLFLLGVAEFSGAMAGGQSPRQPLSWLAGRAAAEAITLPQFMPVNDPASLRQAMTVRPQRPVILDFYADWCASCQEMERDSWPDPRLRAQLARFTLLRADVTRNDAGHAALMTQFGLYGPPAIIVFDADGRERERIVGYIDVEMLSRRLAAIRENGANQ